MNPNENEHFRRTLGSYIAPTPDFYGRSISIPPIRTSNFELNSQLITLVQQNFQDSGKSLLSSWLIYYKLLTQYTLRK
ncbi:hypothetical protein AHAS_Ahas15G0242000 [Arachis hypogaea]